ncbi:MAG: type II secretion system protein [Bacilli bacterium]|nr:type II secretion system protein [Bacilli bacterium]
MNKVKNLKGFTLVELLAVISLVAILSGLAVTNIVSSINNSRKNQFLLDAKRMVSKAEYLMSENRNYRNNAINGSIVVFNYNQLNSKGEFAKDADGTDFVNAYVRVLYDSTAKKYLYCICVTGRSKKIVGSNGTCTSSTVNATSIKNEQACKLSTSLTSIDIVAEN